MTIHLFCLNTNYIWYRWDNCSLALIHLFLNALYAMFFLRHQVDAKRTSNLVWKTILLHLDLIWNRQSTTDKVFIRCPIAFGLARLIKNEPCSWSSLSRKPEKTRVSAIFCCAHRASSRSVRALLSTLKPRTNHKEGMRTQPLPLNWLHSEQDFCSAHPPRRNVHECVWAYSFYVHLST